MSLSCRKYHLPSKRVNRIWLNFHGMLCVFMLGGIARQSYDAKECKSFYYPPTASSYVATSKATERRRYCPMVCTTMCFLPLGFARDLFCVLHLFAAMHVARGCQE